ncbi:MAG: protein-L-isoaspartate O-methyltransferase [Gallionellaceae bacterium]|nr:protein-L-isoaspartate O-methyltransferase [Gallionellaceae bacterium]
MEQARFNMIEQQIRPWNVLDGVVLDLLKQVKREQFVPVEQRAMALMDVEIPLGHSAKMWSPVLEARAVQELKIASGDHVLEVGTGSGYVTALLASLAAEVTSVEIVPELSASAARTLTAQQIKNVKLEVGDAANGWGESHYDAIVLTASVPLQPTALMNNLKIGGRMFAVIGDAPAMHACVITRTASDVFDSVALFETSVAPLQNAAQPQRFVF